MDIGTRMLLLFGAVCAGLYFAIMLVAPATIAGMETFIAWFLLSGCVILFGELADDKRILGTGVIMMMLLCTFDF